MAGDARADETNMVPGDPRDSTPSLARSTPDPGPVVLAVWLGLVFAGINLVVIGVKHSILDRIAFVSRDVWWTLPVTTAVLFASFGVGMEVASRLLRADLRLKGVLFVCTLIGTASVLVNYHLLHPWAAFVLATGIATQSTRLALAHRAAFAVGVRRTILWMLVLALSTGAVVRGSRWWEERQQLASLRPSPAGAPNVLLIVLDTVRAANLSLYGYARLTTPYLSKLAARGAVFTTAFSTAPWTLPSHASMLTGRLETELSSDWMQPLDATFPTLPEVLAAQGYATGAFVGNTVYVNSEVGLARGFARFDSRNLRVGQLLNNDPLGQLLVQNVTFNRVIGIGPVPYCKKAPEVSAPFLAWVGARKQPWFALLNYFDAHEPYEPPEPYLHRFVTSDIQPDSKADDEDPSAPWTAADAERFKMAYDGGIAYLDAELEQLFAALDRQGQLANTLIIITSDHGEEFGEHGRYGHGDTLYLPALHVPLVIVDPRRVPAGTIVDDPVSLRDIPATVLDLIGDSVSFKFPGRSLSTFWRQESVHPAQTLVAGVRKVIGQPESHPLSRGGAIALIDSRYHYIHYFGDAREELFDFRADPWEQSDLAHDPRGRTQIERFRRALEDVPGIAAAR